MEMMTKCFGVNSTEAELVEVMKRHAHCAEIFERPFSCCCENFEHDRDNETMEQEESSINRSKGFATSIQTLTMEHNATQSSKETSNFAVDENQKVLRQIWRRYFAVTE
ncbi:MAG: hypothetical protein CL912_21970 [Deltaproteobacteria bacterium]|nr:hypothetical protein [Deltaproteobacteria bacterium]|tara:strand:+ start:1319 stop:1645 length:327 start_codon:yes stop_codon:yes gene_type:complete